jgi:hypothetical protein
MVRPVDSCTNAPNPWWITCWVGSIDEMDMVKKRDKSLSLLKINHELSSPQLVTLHS